jgi:hypothetical protein
VRWLIVTGSLKPVSKMRNPLAGIGAATMAAVVAAPDAVGGGVVDPDGADAVAQIGGNGGDEDVSGRLMHEGVGTGDVGTPS